MIGPVVNSFYCDDTDSFAHHCKRVRACEALEDRDLPASLQEMDEKIGEEESTPLI